ncbi:hypothetical protein JXM67_00585 [candidate division WOR-3 bacterium]|nr:hypothetical protein [candidate division WOR-3 bacterium]
MLKKLIVLVTVTTVVALAAGVTAVTPKIQMEGVPFYGTIPNAKYPDTSPIQWQSGTAYPLEMMMPATARQIGLTTYDHQQNGAQGNRVVPFPFNNDTCVHVCWTYSADENEDHPNRAVYWNVWSNNASKVYSPTGVKANQNRAGYTTMGILPDGRAVVAFHELLSSSITSDPVSKIAVEAAPGFRVFNSPVQVSQNKFNGDWPIWPHIVIGSDGVIHVVSCNQDTSSKAVCYSRSTNQGGSYSEWVQISDYEGADVGVAVSDDGSKIAIAWVRALLDNFALGHVMYRESTDGGLTWGDPVNITEGYYPADFPPDDDIYRLWADYASPCIAYDKQGNLHIVFEEGLYRHGTDDQFYIFPGYYHRIAYWNEITDDFTIPSGKFGTYRPVSVDEGSGETILDSTLYDMALWGMNPDVYSSDNIMEIGAWKPQLSFWGNNPIVVFCGQRDPADASIAHIPNGDLYVTVSDDNGQTWKPMFDWDYTVVPNRAWWLAERGCVTNLTSSHTPEGRQGFCADEQFATVWPRTTRNNILHVTYQLDRFTGPALSNYPTAGYYSSNPIMYIPVEMTIGTVTGTFNPDGSDYPVIGVSETPSVAQSRVEVLGSNVFTKSVSFAVECPLTTGSLKIYDASGSLVKTVYEGAFTESQTLTWDGTDNFGAKVSNGVYFYSFITSQINESGRLVLVR